MIEEDEHGSDPSANPQNSGSRSSNEEELKENVLNQVRDLDVDEEGNHPVVVQEFKEGELYQQASPPPYYKGNYNSLTEKSPGEYYKLT